MTVQDLVSSVFSAPVRNVARPVEALGVTADSREVQSGFVFVAVRGTHRDGHADITEVIRRGASAIVVEDPGRVPPEYKGEVVRVENARLALARLAAHFYGNPAARMHGVGITGTNGKTTVAYMVEMILHANAWTTGVLGTIDHHLGDRRWQTGLTTPGPELLQRRLADFLRLGARAYVLEVSSHALDQSRVAELGFSVAIFTNITRDHLDYHADMEDYFLAKQKLFSQELAPSGTAVLNFDDPRVRATQVRKGARTVYFGGPGADYRFEIRERSLERSRFTVTTAEEAVVVDLPCPLEHNVANATAAIAAAHALGISLSNAANALAQFGGAPGRLERVFDPGGRLIFVDYAHTPDALGKVLKSLRALCPAGGKTRILTIFGCGGDRDPGKRPLMTQAACEYSDFVILTSDNPRGEDPEQIIESAARGVPKGWPGSFTKIVDRRMAFRAALQCAVDGDVILVAGRGHEEHQIMSSGPIAFSDRSVLTEIIRGS